jgi:hypothetical protein
MNRIVQPVKLQRQEQHIAKATTCSSSGDHLHNAKKKGGGGGGRGRRMPDVVWLSTGDKQCIMLYLRQAS